jgi:hypothetical protein
VTLAPARTLASAGTAGAGAATGTAAYLIVGGLPGVLYAAGIGLAAVVGAIAIRASRAMSAPEPMVALEVPLPRPEPGLAVEPEPAPAADETAAAPVQAPVPEPVPVTDPEALASGSELEEHRAALANLGAQMTRESEAARRDMQRLEKRIRELESERDTALAMVAQERARFEKTLDALCDGIGAELAELEPALEALIAG